MNLKEHLLSVLSEECAEVQQAVSKALRFGLKDCRPESDSTNAKDIEKEFIEAMAVRDMLRELGVITQPDNSKQIYDDKRKRVEKYLELARKNGTLT